MGGLTFELHRKPQDQRPSTRWQSRVPSWCPAFLTCRPRTLQAGWLRADRTPVGRGRLPQTARRAWPGGLPCWSLRSRRFPTIRTRAASAVTPSAITLIVFSGYQLGSYMSGNHQRPGVDVPAEQNRPEATCCGHEHQDCGRCVCSWSRRGWAVSTDEFSLYDAAFVLGALSPADRSEFEDHLKVCAACARSGSELAGCLV